MNKHKTYIQQAINLALKSKGKTSPNPLVGAIVVKNSKIIATGYHKKAGQDHAEIIALKKAGDKAKGATLYITLEPCSTQGKTPPCTETIIKSGIKEVVVAMTDPNPKHQGRGVKILRKNSIKVITSILKKEARAINQPFIKYITKKLPHVTFRIAQTLDGKIATKSGDSNWVTSNIARDYSHKMRDNYDAIMVGANTIMKDNPRLSLNKEIKNKKFYKIVVDTNFKIKPNARIFNDADKFPVIIATSKDFINSKKTKPLAKKNITILEVKKNKKGLLDMKDLLKKLAKMEIVSILVEGGGQLGGSLFDQGLVDYAMFFIAPKVAGGAEILSVQGEGVGKMAGAWGLKDVKMKQLGMDFLIEGVVSEY